MIELRSVEQLTLCSSTGVCLPVALSVGGIEGIEFIAFDIAPICYFHYLSKGCVRRLMALSLSCVIMKTHLDN